jgi:hypothetical protein
MDSRVILEVSEKRKVSCPPGIEMLFPGFRARSLNSIPTPSWLPVSVCSTVSWHEEADVMRTLHNVCSDHMRRQCLYTFACQHVPSSKLLNIFRINLVLSV